MPSIEEVRKVGVEVTVEIPEDAYLALSSSGYSKARISDEARKLLAAHLFRNGILSLGKASEMAGLRMDDFVDLLDELGIPVLDYDEEELDSEFGSG